MYDDNKRLFNRKFRHNETYGFYNADIYMLLHIFIVWRKKKKITIVHTKSSMRMTNKYCMHNLIFYILEIIK